jgi:hypothetical protein
MMGQVDTLHEANDYAITISWDCIPEWTGGCLSVSCSPVKGPFGFRTRVRFSEFYYYCKTNTFFSGETVKNLFSLS